MLACKGIQRHKKKPGQVVSCRAFYKGWVSKHNPYTILNRNFSTEKLFGVFFRRVAKMLTSYPQCLNNIGFDLTSLRKHKCRSIMKNVLWKCAV